MSLLLSVCVKKKYTVYGHFPFYTVQHRYNHTLSAHITFEWRGLKKMVDFLPLIIIKTERYVRKIIEKHYAGWLLFSVLKNALPRMAKKPPLELLSFKE